MVVLQLVLVPHTAAHCGLRVFDATSGWSRLVTVLSQSARAGWATPYGCREAMHQKGISCNKQGERMTGIICGAFGVEGQRVVVDNFHRLPEIFPVLGLCCKFAT